MAQEGRAVLADLAESILQRNKVTLFFRDNCLNESGILFLLLPRRHRGSNHQSKELKQKKGKLINFHETVLKQKQLEEAKKLELKIIQNQKEILIKEKIKN